MNAVALVCVLLGAVILTLSINEEAVKCVLVVVAAVVVSFALDTGKERRERASLKRISAPQALTSGLACASVFAAVRTLVPMDFTVRTAGGRFIEIALAFETGVFITLPAYAEALATSYQPTPRRGVCASFLVFLAGALAWGLADLATAYTRAIFLGADKGTAHELVALGLSGWRDPGFVFYVACQGLVFIPVVHLRIRDTGVPRTLMGGLLGAVLVSVAGRAIAGSNAGPEFGQAFASSFAAAIAFSLGPCLAGLCWRRGE